MEAVRKALELALPEYGNLHIQRSPRAILVTKQGEDFRFEQLSDGEKCYFTLIADIARRIAMANPDHHNPLQCEGIVLIDEVDLHLHPLWQQAVIDNLTHAFPKVQFVLSTHSPFVISSTKVNVNEKIIAFDNGMPSPMEESMYGATVDDVLLRLFKLGTLRNAEVQQHIEKTWKILENPHYCQKELDETLNWLKTNLSPSDMEFAHIALEIARLKKMEAKP